MLDFVVERGWFGGYNAKIMDADVCLYSSRSFRHMDEATLWARRTLLRLQTPRSDLAVRIGGRDYHPCDLSGYHALCRWTRTHGSAAALEVEKAKIHGECGAREKFWIPSGSWGSGFFFWGGLTRYPWGKRPKSPHSKAKRDRRRKAKEIAFELACMHDAEEMADAESELSCRASSEDAPWLYSEVMRLTQACAEYEVAARTLRQELSLREGKGSYSPPVTVGMEEVAYAAAFLGRSDTVGDPGKWVRELASAFCATWSDPTRWMFRGATLVPSRWGMQSDYRFTLDGLHPADCHLAWRSDSQCLIWLFLALSEENGKILLLNMCGQEHADRMYDCFLNLRMRVAETVIKILGGLV